MSYFNSTDRWTNVPDIDRPNSSGDNDLEPSDTRNDDRRGGDESYDAWLSRQTSSGWPEWFVRWAFPREQYDNTDEWKGFKNVGSFMAAMFGLGAGGSLLSAGGNLLAADKILSDKQTASADSGSGFMNFLKNFFSGSGSNSGLFGSFGDVLSGLGSQFGSSWLNYKNMEKLIDKQNEYNTPANQMARFQAAGLNPNLIYGLGSNGNQPASGSIAPVDFDTSQRENRLARMQIDTTNKLVNKQIEEKNSIINLNQQNADEAAERKKAQAMANQTYFATWFSEQMIRVQQARQIANNIQNDKRRVDFEEKLAKAETDLKKAQELNQSPLGKYAHDVVVIMQTVNSELSETLGDLNELLPEDMKRDTIGRPTTSKENWDGRTPPGFGYSR